MKKFFVALAFILVVAITTQTQPTTPSNDGINTTGTTSWLIVEDWILI